MKVGLGFAGVCRVALVQVQDGVLLLQQVKELSSDNFVQVHPYPFLVSLESEKSASMIFKSMLAKDTLTALADISARIAVFPVTKRPNSELPADRIVVGRSEQADLVVPHKLVSKLHAFFVHDPENDRYELVDAGSRNGTTLNGKSLEPKKPHLLEIGDSISFGPFSFKLVSARQLHQRLSQDIEQEWVRRGKLWP